MKKFQIAVVGINSLYGSTSALLLKQSPFIKCLKLFDPRDVENGLDVATINTQCKVKTFLGHDQLENAFREADIIVISDESGEMVDSEAHLMNVSANLTKYAKAISRASPDAIIVLASPPVNCLLPIMSQLLAKAGCYNHNKVVGSTSVDTMRASALLASHLNIDPKEVVLPVIGGGSESTRVPVFSQSRPHFSLKQDVKSNLIMDIRRGDSLVLANKGRPEALNRAHSTVRFLNSIMAGLRGDPNVTDITLCRTDVVPGVDYFSLPVMFGREGIIKRFGVPNTTATEDEMVAEAIKHVKRDTDKANYIVKGTIELPKHKYLTANDLPSQKDIFDLFVKTLPKPPDNNQNAPENESKKATDYSFKGLIKDDRRGPFEVFDKKSHRPALASQMKNVNSADSFLKSAGCYTSPLQKPILILDPLGCPSRPLETDEDRELDEFFESEDVLHENNLVRFRNKETYGECLQNFTPSPTKNQPFLTTEHVRPKTIDPIANFKAQIAKFHEYRKHENKPEVDENQLAEKSSAENLDHRTDLKTTAASNGAKITNKTKTKASNEKPSFSTAKNGAKCEELTPIPKKEIHFSSPSGRCMKKKYGTSDKTNSYVYDIKTNRIIPPYNLYKKGESGKVDYVPEEENGKAYMPRSDVEEPLYIRGGLEGTENDAKYNKLVSRLFRKLNGLNDGYFPLKASNENVNTPKCQKSFTESAVLCRSPNSTSFKMRKKHKKPMSAMESGDHADFPEEVTVTTKKNRQSEDETKSHSRNQRETSKFKEIKEISPSHQETELRENNNELHFVCPKCRIKITCQPEKNEKITSQRPESMASDISQTDERKTQRNVVMNLYKARDSQHLTQDKGLTAKNPSELNLQEERLKKLKEKINKKLIPMMRQNPDLHGKEDTLTPSQLPIKPAKDLKITQCKNVGRELGSSLVSAKDSEPISKHSEASRSGPSEKWQGVPFIVKQNENKSERNDGKNRAVFMKLVAPPAIEDDVKEVGELHKGQRKKTSEVEQKDSAIKIKAVSKISTETLSVESSGKTGKRPVKILNKLQSTEIKNTVEHQSVESNGKTGNRAAKILNKLQLLELEGRRKIMEVTESEMQEKKETDKFHKERMKREISLDLKADDVQNYMMTRQRGGRNFMTKVSPDEKVVDIPSGVFEKIDHDNFKTESVKETSHAVSLESKLVKDESDKVPVAADVNKLRVTVTASVKNNEVKAESNASVVDNKAEENQALADDDVQNTTEAEKIMTKEPVWAMTSPSKNFESIEESALSTTQNNNKVNVPDVSSKDLEAIPKMQSAADKKAYQKSAKSAKPTSNQSVTVFHKTPNKLQLLAKVRNLKRSDNEAFKIKLHRKLKNVWENVLSEKPVKTKFDPVVLPQSLKHVDAAFEKLDKKSAAVKMAKKSYSAQKKCNLYRTKRVPNDVGILDGLTFPARRKRKPTNNLLKELASVSKRRETVKLKPKANLKGVVKKAIVKPLERVHLGKDTRTSFEPESSEYAQDEMQMAKLASEILKKKTLQTALDFRNREWSHTKDTAKTRGTFTKVKKLQVSKNLVPIDRPSSSLLELPIKASKSSKPAHKSSYVMNKLMSMPHVRHQVENFELPLGPLEVQPGLAHLNYSKVGVSSPVQSDGGWESNEYTRSNALPSLRDTREMFYLEEHPS